MNVRIFLRTPLHRGRRLSGSGQNFELDASIVEVIGVLVDKEPFLEIEVREFIDDRGRTVASPWPRLYLAASKVDYYVPLEDE